MELVYIEYLSNFNMIKFKLENLPEEVLNTRIEFLGRDPQYRLYVGLIGVVFLVINLVVITIYFRFVSYSNICLLL